jgi:hypothetical protein
MSTSTFPTSLDSYTNPSSTNAVNSPSLAAGQTLQNDSLAALETKIGIDNSSVTTTIDYKVKNAASPINSAITQLQQNVITLYTDTGSANTYVITPTVSIGAYAKGQVFFFIAANTNTGASTLNVNGLGAKAIKYQGIVLPAGFIQTLTTVQVMYDGTQFQLLNPASSLLGFVDITAGFITTNTTETPITGMTITVNVPAGRRVRLILYVEHISTTGVPGALIIAISESGVDLQRNQTNNATSTRPDLGGPVIHILSPTAGAHTYYAQVSQNTSGTLTIDSGFHTQLSAELI